MPLAEAYAADLDGAEKRGEFPDQTDRDGIRDTIAFVSLVAEASKEKPDKSQIKNDIAIFKESIVRQEEAERAEPFSTRLERATLNASRVHLSSALQLYQQ